MAFYQKVLRGNVDLRAATQQGASQPAGPGDRMMPAQLEADGGRTQRPNQLVLEVCGADEETEAFHRVASKADAQTSPLQCAPEVILLSGVTETGQSQSGTTRAIESQRSADVGGAPNWHDGDAFGFEISTTPLG